MQQIKIDYTAPSSNEIFGNVINKDYMKITFVSHSILHLAKPKSNVGVIRISDDDYFGSRDGWGLFEAIRFYDVDNYQLSLKERLLANLPLPEHWMNKIVQKQSTYYPWHPILKTDAQKIAGWCKQANKLMLDELVFSCNYGKSRSAGAAKAAAEYFNDRSFSVNKHNTRVYEEIKLALNQ